MTVRYKSNSPVLVMKITSVSQLLTCTKAPSLATAPFDSCHSRVIRNQQNLYVIFPPTTVVKLLQYSGLRSNTGMGFLRTNDLSEGKNGQLNFDFKVLIKTGGLVVYKLKFK